MAASEHSPHAVALARAGLLAIRAGHYRRSSALLARAVELDPTLGEAWRWLGALHNGARRAICLQWAQRAIPGASIPELPAPKVAPSAAQPALSAPGPASIPAAARRLSAPKAQRRRPALLAVGGLAVASALALGGFEVVYAERIYPGVQAFGHSLSGLSQPEAEQVLAARLGAWSRQQVTLRMGERQWTVPFSALADFRPASVAARAYDIGRSGGLGERISAQSGALLSQQAGPGLPLSDRSLEALWSRLNAEIARQPRDAAFAINPDGSWSAMPDQTGLSLNRAAADDALRQAWSSVRWDAAPAALVFDLPVSQLPPARTTAAVESALPALRRQTAAPLRLVFGGSAWELGRAGLLNLAAE
ncbi:MAG TPA: peptidoglycan binding domain-containing protein, partial [Herpetosiphonaceae bacterium]